MDVVDEAKVDRRLSTDSLNSFDPDEFLQRSFCSLREQQHQDAQKTDKEVRVKKRHATQRAIAAEQSSTTLEEIWEHLCAKYGPNPFSIEASTFVDTMWKCTRLGLGAELARVVNGRSALTFIDLEARDFGYLCYLILEEIDPDDCGRELLAMLADEDFKQLGKEEALRQHTDSRVQLPHFRKLIPIVAEMLHLDVAYVLATLVWSERQRFEMPLELFKIFFTKSNSSRFLKADEPNDVFERLSTNNSGHISPSPKTPSRSNDHRHSLSSSPKSDDRNSLCKGRSSISKDSSGRLSPAPSNEPDNVAFGHLDQNGFVRLCHSLEIIDSRERHGKAWEFCITFWTGFMKNVDEHVKNYVNRRPAATFIGDAKAKRHATVPHVPNVHKGGHTESHDHGVLSGRTELTAMLECLYLNLPKGVYGSPFHLCIHYLLDEDEKRGTQSCPAVFAGHKVDKTDRSKVTPGATPANKSLLRKSTRAEIKKLFDAEDGNHNGLLELEELASILRKGNPDILDSEIETLFRLADYDESGVIDFDKFVKLVTSEDDPLRLSLNGRANVQSLKFADDACASEKIRCLRMFSQTDADRSINLDFDELCTLLRRGKTSMTDVEIRKLFDAADVNGNGVISYPEFVEYIWSTTNVGQKSLSVPTKPAAKRNNWH